MYTRGGTILKLHLTITVTKNNSKNKIIMIITFLMINVIC